MEAGRGSRPHAVRVQPRLSVISLPIEAHEAHRAPPCTRPPDFSVPRGRRNCATCGRLLRRMRGGGTTLGRGGVEGCASLHAVDAARDAAMRAREGLCAHIPPVGGRGQVSVGGPLCGRRGAARTGPKGACSTACVRGCSAI